ncbi:FAD-dependent monooxygenase [Streptomyces tremellae]|uniref:FAD-binding domain-containing protein n=1 Tax=Streptomyces tremellae TaxID=1124239 RepID=A0ABP7EW05_9ACTN
MRPPPSGDGSGPGPYARFHDREHHDALGPCLPGGGAGQDERRPEGDAHGPAGQHAELHADVCVIGAGPAGLTLALLLLRSGATVAVAERSRGFTREFRGEILQPGGLRVLDDLGVLAAASGHGAQSHTGFQLVDGRRILLDIDYSRLTGPHNHLLALNQRHLLTELLHACRQHPRFTYLSGHRLTSLTTTRERYTAATTRHAAGHTTVHARVIVGADGRYSQTRRLAGIRHERMDVFDHDVVWFKLRTSGPLPRHVRVHRNAGQAFLVHASHPRTLSVGWTIPHRSWNTLAGQGIEGVKDRIAGALPAHRRLVHDQLDGLGDLTLLDVFAARAGTWTAPGLVLIGDAAHTHSPLGAQGINLALQDAATLHPHLLDVLGTAQGDPRADELLHRYARQRAPAVNSVFRFQTAQAKTMLRTSPLADTVRPVLARLVQHTPLGTHLTHRIAHGRTPVATRTDLFRP